VDDRLRAVMSRRKSCRNFLDMEISPTSHEDIIWAGQRAPYASGGPRRDIWWTKNIDVKKKLSNAGFGQPYIADCSHVYVICGKDFNKEAVLKSGFPKFVHDCDMAVCQMHLMATALGLGSCIIGHFKVDQVKDIMLTELRPTIILIVGIKK
jgi:nitroreductase